VTAAGSWAARAYLGVPGGPASDLVTYEADPRDDLAVLARPPAIVRHGIRVR
jgi:hypothetical protein